MRRYLKLCGRGRDQLFGHVRLRRKYIVAHDLIFPSPLFQLGYRLCIVGERRGARVLICVLPQLLGVLETLQLLFVKNRYVDIVFVLVLQLFSMAFVIIIKLVVSLLTFDSNSIYIIILDKHLWFDRKFALLLSTKSCCEKYQTKWLS